MKETGELLYLRHKRCLGFDFCNGNLSHGITSYWILESLVKFGNVRKCLCAPRRMSANLQQTVRSIWKTVGEGGGGCSPLHPSCILVLSSIPLCKIRLRLKGSTVLKAMHREIYQLMTCPLHLNADLRLMVRWSILGFKVDYSLQSQQSNSRGFVHYLTRRVEGAEFE